MSGTTTPFDEMERLAQVATDAVRECGERLNALRAVALAVLAATDAYRDALNGQGHEGPHDRAIHIDPCTSVPGVEHIYDTTGDCAQCGGAQYGTEDTLQGAIGDLREAVGQERMAWEYHRG